MKIYRIVHQNWILFHMMLLVMGVSILVLVILVTQITKKLKVFLFLLLCIIVCPILGVYVTLLLLQRSQLHDTILRANLIKLKEAIQQAERRSMNKSLAFASASHDIRTSLAAISGLIEICRIDIPQDSELYRTIEQMDNCVSKLLDILNSVLDISKIEAGKMQLEEMEFDICQVLEESVDNFHAVALKKRLDIIWDPCDCSIFIATNVIGDCRRLKQIVDNLLGNAVKFTSEGHVVLRAWAKKSNLENQEVSSKSHCKKNLLKSPFRWVSKDRGHQSYLSNPVQNNLSSIEIVIEVDDTGIGVPKEKRDSIFENYVQVKESSTREHEGTGLGLGIVQSYVRLMGGEIKIEDKNPSERGACFRFNIFLRSNDTSEINEDDKGIDEVSSILPIQPRQRRNLRNPQRLQSIARSLTFKRGLASDAIHSLLFVEGDETRRIMQRWMESLGVKVWVVSYWEHIYPTLEKIKHNLTLLGKSKSKSLSSFLNIAADFSNSEKESDKSLPLTKKEVTNCSRSYKTNLLVVVDLSHKNFSAVASTLKTFTSNAATIDYKIVWLVNSSALSDDLRRFKEVPVHLILHKPIHGSRLYAILRLLQDFESRTQDSSPEKHTLDTTLITEQHNESVSSMESNTVSNSLVSQVGQHADHLLPKRNSGDEKPLAGMNILLVEDTATLRHVATKMISRLGATVTSSENGLDALNLIRDTLRGLESLQGNAGRGDSKGFPYDAIIMDCEMPIMSGYEATRHIREEERSYGLRIPIIALTAHASSEEERKTILAGMDFHLTKPLQANKLIDAMTTVCEGRK